MKNPWVKDENRQQGLLLQSSASQTYEFRPIQESHSYSMLLNGHTETKDAKTTHVPLCDIPEDEIWIVDAHVVARRDDSSGVWNLKASVSSKEVIGSVSMDFTRCKNDFVMFHPYICVEKGKLVVTVRGIGKWVVRANVICVKDF